MDAVSEAETLTCRCNQLEAVLVAGFLALLIEAVAVVGVRVWVDGFVFVDVC